MTPFSESRSPRSLASLTIYRFVASWLVATTFFSTGFLASPAVSLADAPRPNILFIAIDDLNDWVTHLGGHPQARTPNIDRLAARGVSFVNAHCAAPVCNPSRAALMSGLRPSTSGVYNNNIDWRNFVPASLDTLPAYLTRQGYASLGAGKIYHGGFPRASAWHEYLKESHGDLKPAPGHDGGVGGIRFAPVVGEDSDIVDFETVEWCSDQLKKKHDKPFFLACGLHKPHMAWNVPQKYYDMFPLDKIVLPKVLDNDLDDVPPSGVKMANPNGDHKTMLESGRWKEAVQAYLAAGAFADVMVGRMLDALDRSPYKDNTVVVLWGDHGWHLGEKQHWRKFALWEEATRAPLIFSAPGVTKPGQICRQPVDFMSIYPTLVDLCGLQVPKHVEGPSLRPLLANVDAPWNHVAVTTHGYGNHAVRTDHWRYIRYANGEEELYDHRNDPQEWTNLAGKAEHAALKSELAQHMPQVNAKTPDVEKGEKSKEDKAKKKAKKGKT